MSKLFIGTKSITAQEMSAAEWVASIISVNKPVNPVDEPGYKVTYPSGYTHWLSKAEFEEFYRPLI